jgi:hypothetical protein
VLRHHRIDLTGGPPQVRAEDRRSDRRDQYPQRHCPGHHDQNL